MDRYAQWCAIVGRIFGVTFVLIFGAACALRSWAPLNALPGPLFSAVLVYGIGGPMILRSEDREPSRRKVLDVPDLWPPGSVARHDGQRTPAAARASITAGTFLSPLAEI